MNSKICHDILVGIPEYFQKHQHMLLSIVEHTIFYFANCAFPEFWAIPFDTKLRFSRILSHPFLIQKSFFWPEKRWIRKSVTIHLLAYQSTFKNTSTCRAYHILHCKIAIFPNFKPSLLIQKSFFWPEKRWIRKSVRIPLLAYQSTFKNTSTCSLHRRALQTCDFPEFWAIPFDTKVIFFTRERMNSKICHHTLVGIPEYFQKHRILSHPCWYKSPFFWPEKRWIRKSITIHLLAYAEYFQKHQHLLLSIVEFTIFYIAKVRFSGILSHPFWYKSHFFDQRKDEFENLSAVHLLAYQSTFKNTSTCCSPS